MLRLTAAPRLLWAGLLLLSISSLVRSQDEYKNLKTQAEELGKAYPQMLKILFPAAADKLRLPAAGKTVVYQDPESSKKP